MCAAYHGKSGVAYISTDGSAAASVISLREWSLSMKTDRVDTTSFGASNKTSVQGLPDVSGNLSGYWDDTSDTLYDASRSSAAVRMYLYPSSLVPGKYFCGLAGIDFNIETAVDQAVKVSGSFAAAGDWSQF
jgi:hypothetical protein